MGEYWKPVNVTRREYIHPHHVNEGLKLAEWTWRGSAVLALLAAWSPEDDVRVVSDYGGDIRVTDKARESNTAVDYEEIGGWPELKAMPDVAPSDLAKLIVATVAPSIRYEDWHEAWKEPP